MTVNAVGDDMTHDVDSIIDSQDGEGTPEINQMTSSRYENSPVVSNAQRIIVTEEDQDEIPEVGL